MELELNEWVWNSHYWIETYIGYFKCKYCEANWTSEMPINSGVKLCKRNPRIRYLLNKIYEKKD